MGRRYSGNAGGTAGAGGAAPRAIVASQQVPLQGGPLFTLTRPNLLQPIAFSKIGGNGNLTVDAATGAISAGAALIGGASQSITGAVAGADGVTIPFAVTLSGLVSAPAAPTLSGVPAPGQVTLSWTDGADNGAAITGHTLYRGTAAGGEVPIGTIAGAPPFVDRGLSNGTRYFYRISATNNVGEGAQSGEIALTPANLAAAPDLTLTGGNAQVAVAWTDGSDGGAAITAHKLYRGTTAGGEVLVGTLAGASPFVDTGLTNGSTYFYRLSAINAVGESALSIEASAMPATAPAAPTMTLTPAIGQVSIAWTDGAANGSTITAHKLYRGMTPGGEVLVGTIASASPFVDTGRSAGQTYYYRLSAVNGVGEGALSIEASATVPGGAAALTPLNWDFVAYGDSRTENAMVATLTSGNGYSTGSAGLGPAGYIPLATGNRLRLARCANYGISVSTTIQGAAIPRQTYSGTVTNSTPQTWWHGVGNNLAQGGGDSTNKGADYVANSGAGVVVILYGTNDQAADLPANSRAAMLAILNNLRGTQLKLIFNETPKGYKSTGAGTSYTTSQAFKDHSAWLSTLDYASGSPNARSDVIVIDSWGLSYDSATGGNKVGYLRDGLHFTPWGARQLATALHNRLTAAFGSAYTSLPSQAVLPVSNGATIAADTIGAHAPFVHTNPLLTPGGNGTVQGANFGTAPSAATVPQGWIIQGSGTYAGIAVSCDKTGVDSEGYPMWTVTVSGTLADQGSYTLNMLQNAQAAGQTIAVTDKLRGVARIGIGAGSQMLNYVRVRVPISDGTAARNQTASAMSGSAGGTGDRDGYLINSNGFDAGGTRDVILTPTIDLADPNMSVASGGPGVLASISSQGFYIDAVFNNFTGSAQNVAATIQISRAGVYKVA